MLQVVDFKTLAGDTGRDTSDSIEPVADGESADQVVLRRPTEHVRSRTQTLRELARESLLRHDFGPSLLYDGGLITPNGTMTKFTLGADLYVLPLNTAGTDVTAPYLQSSKSTLSVGTPSNNEVVFTSVQRAFEGATAAADVNKISVEINDEGAGASLSISVTDRHITVGIDAAAHTCNDVIGLVNGDAAAALLVLASLGAGSTGTNLCDVFDATTWSDVSDRYLRGGLPGVAHQITPAGLATFFGTAANELQPGDTLAIAYDEVVSETTTGGRFQSTPENTNINVDAALFNTRRYPEKVPNCIPICKRVDNSTFMFANGAIFNFLKPAYLYFDTMAFLAVKNGLIDAGSWDRIGDGPDHNPPGTVQEAFDNADGRLHEVMGEVETARDSALLGAQSSLDARLEADTDHIGRTVVTVSDGTNSTGGQYNGATALEDALTAEGAGRTYLVRAGDYTITTAHAFSDRVRIIAQDKGAVTLTCNVPAGYVFSFNAGSDGSLIDGVQLLWSTGTQSLLSVAAGVRHVRIQNSPLIENLQLVSAGRHFRIDGCYFYMDSTVDVIVLGGTSHTIIEGCTLDIADTDIAAIILDAGGTGSDKQLVIRNCEMTLGNGSQRLIYTGNNSHQTVLDNIKITCNPYTDTTRAVIQLQGEQQSIRNVRMVVGGTGTIQQPLFSLIGSGTISEMQMDLNGQTLGFNAAGKQPFRVQATQAGDIRVNNLTVIGIQFPNDWLNREYPVITGVPSSSRSAVIFDGLTIYDFGDAGTPTTYHAGTVVGSEATSGYIPSGSGPLIVRNANIDTTGLSYHGLLDEYVIITNLPINSTVEDCLIYGGGTHWGIVARGAQGYTIRNNRIYVLDDCGSQITVRSNSASGLPDYCNVESNFVQHGANRSNLDAIFISGWDGSNYTQRSKVTNNTVIWTGAGSWTGSSIYIFYCNKGTVFHNNVSSGITYAITSNMLPVAGSLGTYNILA